MHVLAFILNSKKEPILIKKYSGWHESHPLQIQITYF